MSSEKKVTYDPENSGSNPGQQWGEGSVPGRPSRRHRREYLGRTGVCRGAYLRRQVRGKGNAKEYLIEFRAGGGGNNDRKIKWNISSQK